MLDHVIYGSVTVNAKWQIVLPAEVRKKMNISSWDQLIMIGRGSTFAWFIKAENIWEFIEKMNEYANNPEDNWLCVPKEQLIKDMNKLWEYISNNNAKNSLIAD